MSSLSALSVFFLRSARSCTQGAGLVVCFGHLKSPLVGKSTVIKILKKNNNTFLVHIIFIACKTLCKSCFGFKYLFFCILFYDTEHRNRCFDEGDWRIVYEVWFGGFFYCKEGLRIRKKVTYVTYEKIRHPYIVHPISAARELMTIQPDMVTPVSTIIHDTVSNGNATLDEIEKYFELKYAV